MPDESNETEVKILLGVYVPVCLILLTTDFWDHAGVIGTARSDPDVWTGYVSQERVYWISEVADMYPACLIGSRVVALMGIRTRHRFH